MSGLLPADFTWFPLDTWIVVVGAMCAASCALLGTFLVLRKMSMMGDAISHAVLPGLAIAFLITGSRESMTMLLGAAVVGVLTAAFTQWIHSAGDVDEGASMGVVFTVLFAIGLIVMRRAADHVDLDPGCVLYGAIETVPLDTVALLGLKVPRAALVIGAALLLDLLFVVLFYKELKISTFDPALATTLGINSRLMHYLLMTLVAVTTVAAFEAVGSILVIAMLIVPAAAAHLLTDRLSWMLVLSVAIGVLSAPLGHVGAIAAPGWLGFGDMSTISSGMMAVAAGAMFVVALLLGPRHGIIVKALHRAALSARIVREDALGLLFRLEEAGGDGRTRAAQLQAATAGAAPLLGRFALRRLRRQGKIARRGDHYLLTDDGRREARELVRSHRLWESYLDRHLSLPPDHLHEPAHRLEHVTGPALQTRLAAGAGEPTRDPHGSPIPDAGGPPASPQGRQSREGSPEAG